MGHWCPSGWKFSNWRINWFVGIIFITFNRKLQLFDNFWIFKTQNTEYNCLYIENYIYKKLKEAVEIYKNQTKNHSVSAKIYKVYIICTPKCDAFGNSFFPLLAIMECYKPNRWRMLCFLYPPLHSTRIVFASFGDLVNVLRDYHSIRVGSSFKERQFVRMLHVINEVTTGHIHQIKENAEAKSNRWLSIQMICGNTFIFWNFPS